MHLPGPGASEAEAEVSGDLCAGRSVQHPAEATVPTDDTGLMHRAVDIHHRSIHEASPSSHKSAKNPPKDNKADDPGLAQHPLLADGGMVSGNPPSTAPMLNVSTMNISQKQTDVGDRHEPPAAVEGSVHAATILHKPDGGMQSAQPPATPNIGTCGHSPKPTGVRPAVLGHSSH